MTKMIVCHQLYIPCGLGLLVSKDCDNDNSGSLKFPMDALNALVNKFNTCPGTLEIVEPNPVYNPLIALTMAWMSI